MHSDRRGVRFAHKDLMMAFEGVFGWAVLHKTGAFVRHIAVDEEKRRMEGRSNSIMVIHNLSCR